MSDSTGSGADRRRGNLRIGLGILFGGGTGFLLGTASAAWAGQPRWLGVGLVFGAAAGLILGVVSAGKLRDRQRTR